MENFNEVNDKKPIIATFNHRLNSTALKYKNLRRKIAEMSTQKKNNRLANVVSMYEELKRIGVVKNC